MNPEFLKKLRCPVSQQSLRFDSQTNELISDQAQLAYPIQDGIPILLKEQARSLKATEEGSEN